MENKMWGMLKKSSLHISINLGPTYVMITYLLKTNVFHLFLLIGRWEFL